MAAMVRGRDQVDGWQSMDKALQTSSSNVQSLSCRSRRSSKATKSELFSSTRQLSLQRANRVRVAARFHGASAYTMLHARRSRRQHEKHPDSKVHRRNCPWHQKRSGGDASQGHEALLDRPRCLILFCSVSGAVSIGGACRAVDREVVG